MHTANLHKPDLTYRMFDSLNAVYQDTKCLDAWNQVFSTSGGNICMDLRLLKALEATMADVSQFYYIIMYGKPGKPIACAVLTTFRMDLAVIAGARIQRLTNLLRRILPSLLRVTVLFCGLPFSVGEKSLLIAPSANARAVLVLLDIIACEVAARENAQVIVYKEFGDEDVAQLDILVGRGYRRGKSLVMHHFPPRFQDFTGYTASLRAFYRKCVLRSGRKFTEAGLQMVRYRDPESIKRVYTPEVHRLYEAVFEKAKNKLEHLPLEFFRELAQQFPGAISLTALYYQERIVAFGWALSTGQTYHLLYCGLDYAVNEQFDLYFNVMYAELDHGLREGVTDIKLGQTADTFKVQLGCKQQPLYFYIKGARLLWNLCIKVGFKFLFPNRPLPPTYKVFKDKQ
jgi:GNAT acetyltransferase-like protein